MWPKAHGLDLLALARAKVHTCSNHPPYLEYDQVQLEPGSSLVLLPLPKE